MKEIVAAAGSAVLLIAGILALYRLGRRHELSMVNQWAQTSHFELLRAFTPDAILAAADRTLEDMGYRTHEFGDSVFVERYRPTQ